MSGPASSPNSSNEVTSHHGTPETRLTAFSPGDGRTSGRSPLTLKLEYDEDEEISSRQFSVTAAGTSVSTQADPFLSGGRTGYVGSVRQRTMRLSPTALDFTPSTGSTFAELAAAQLSPRGLKERGVSFLTATSLPMAKYGSGYSRLQSNGSTGISRLESIGTIGNARIECSGAMSTSRFQSVGSTGFSRLHSNGLPDSPVSPGTPPAAITPIGKPLAPTSSQINIGSFTSDDGFTRAIAVEKIHLMISAEDVADFFSVHQYPSLKAHVFSELATKGNVYVAFADVRDANLAFSNARAISQWKVRRLKPTDFVVKTKPQLARFVSEFEGQVTATIYCPLSEARSHQNSTGPKLLKDILEKYGEIKAFRTLVQGSLDGVSEYHVEFYDTRAADNAVFSLDTTQFGDFILTVHYHQPDQPKHQQRDPMVSLTTGIGQVDVSGLHDDRVYTPTAVRRRALNSVMARGPDGYNLGRRPSYLQLSPTGRSTIPRGAFGGPQAADSLGAAAFLTAKERQGGKQSSGHFSGLRLDSAMASPSMIPRSMPKGGRNDIGQHNTVDTERICLGLDVRTTIMLRNIPNKIDQTMLKAIVDETSHGKYDFMYLRIDFANNCNVGYAFINFEDPYYIIDFVKAKAGQRWNRFNSDKVAEVSYATIQGKDCLVQKFRNSSVMLEHPSFRPKIFVTGTGPSAGTEDVFPGPDNPSKMRRSVENAEHVGLFAPRAGQQFRDEQRRRRSHYDRGTRLAQVEDALAVGHGWIEGDYWVRFPGSNNLVRVSPLHEED